MSRTAWESPWPSSWPGSASSVPQCRGSCAAGTYDRAGQVRTGRMTEQLSRLRAFDGRQPVVWDLAVALVCGAASVSASVHLDVYGAVAIAIVTIAVALRR